MSAWVALVGVALTACAEPTPPALVPANTVDLHSESGPLIVLGDTQLVSCPEHLLLREDNSEEQQELLRQIASDAERIHPAFVVHLGDSVAVGDSAKQWAYYRALVSPLTSRGLVVRAVMGNHDYWGDEEVALRLAAEAHSDLSQETYYADVHRGLGLIWLDTAGGDELWSQQLTWIEQLMNDFQQNPSIRGVVVFGHHPPFTTARYRRGSEDVRTLASRLERYPKFVAMFSGHVHGYERFERGGRHYVISGGAGGPRVSYRGRGSANRANEVSFRLNRRVGARHRLPFNYLILTLQRASIEVTVRCLQGSQGCATGTLERFTIQLPGVAKQVNATPPR
jgi:Icc-related predicted phosphoesterase